MRDITQEFEFEEEKGPPVHLKLHKIMQDLIWGIFKKDKLESVIEKNLPPKHLENLDPTKVNPEVWNKISHKTKSIDIRQQHIQSYILKVLIVATKNVDKIFQAKKNKETDWSEIAKNCIKLSADTAMILDKENYELLSLRRAQIIPELNYRYRQLLLDQGDHPKLLFGDNLPKQIKEISETNKVGYALSKKPYSPSSTISVNPNNQHRNQSFLWRGQKNPRGRQRHQHNQRHPYQRSQNRTVCGIKTKGTRTNTNNI